MLGRQSQDREGARHEVLRAGAHIRLEYARLLAMVAAREHVLTVEHPGVEVVSKVAGRDAAREPECDEFVARHYRCLQGCEHAAAVRERAADRRDGAVAIDEIREPAEESSRARG